MKTLLKSLKEKALKATRSPWFYHGLGQVHRVTTCSDLGHETFKERICELNNEAYVGREEVESNGRFIASCDPQTILKLIECIEGLTGALRNECHVTDHILGGIDDCPPCRVAYHWDKKFSLD